MSKRTKENKVQSLISISPKLYDEITSKLFEKYHIHTYDLQVDAVEKADGIHIFLKFGEHFSQEKDQYFSHTMLKDGRSLATFIEDVGEACKKVMIEDYFDKMTP